MKAASALDYRELARRRLPRFLFEYIDGGSYAEVTLRRNVEDLERIALRQRVLRNVADLDLSGGHVDDAFDRLLTLFPTLDAEGKEAVRARILEYFEIVGVEDPRVGKARARLASLLY